MPIKILLIEDNPDHIEITKRILQKQGGDYLFDFATDPLEGLKKIFEKPYDAVLCDYHLPGLTALDILKEINNKNMDLPFIVITALGSEKIAVDMMKAGAYDYIVKDVLYSDTLDIIIKKAIDRFKSKKEKERLEEEIREAYDKLKETQDQLVQAEKLNAIGQLASGVAHEVRNPLAIILQGLNYLESNLQNKGSDIQDTLTVLKDNVNRADKIINALLDFSRPATLDLQPANMNDILETSLGLVKNHLENKNIEISFEIKPGIPKVLVDKNRLEQVFINLLLNAIQAMPNGGKIAIRSYDQQLERIKHGIGRRENDDFQIGDRVVIVDIEDTGTGIPADNLRKVFDPFFTTKSPNGGHGLGLPVTQSIVNMHKGLIEIESQLGKGTKAIVTLRAITEVSQ